MQAIKRATQFGSDCIFTGPGPSGPRMQKGKETPATKQAQHVHHDTVGHDANSFSLSGRIKSTSALGINRPTLLTDNQSLAKVAASSQLDHQLLRWDVRDVLACFFTISSCLLSQVFHIKRDLNGVAHNCAHQALRRSLDQPIYSCVTLAHTPDQCPVISAIKNINLQDFVIHAVLCT